MAHLWRLSVAVILLTLAPMHVAWAECAWVLWSEFSAIGDNPVHRWTMHAAYPGGGYERCVGDARTHASRYVDGPNVLSVELKELIGDQFGQLMKFKTGRGHHWTRYACYPDTIDPRGPKGGGR
jgi:hypothetical protein